ncbi:MAG: hypothetical protein IJH64_00885 [Oscillospiraceae bacterium]|nr:hypothetical protein [Oscillospiraceae bacterium]
MNYKEMQKRNIFDADIANQPEIEYRKAKPPFVIKHKSINKENGKEITWYSTHCPVCFWDGRHGLWDCMIDKDTLFCRRCGQKIDWSDPDEDS